MGSPSPRLTADQLKAVEAAMEVAKTAGHMSLIGPAGCGKTTTIRAIAHAAREAYPSKQVLLLAPTHKARQQFAVNSLPSGVVRQTVHWFVQVSPSTWRDEDKFNISNSGDLRRVEETRSRFSLVIVDESSMVCKEHAGKTLDICDAAGVGVIFSGDPYQLPPIASGGQADDETDGPDVEATESTLAPQFVDAPIRVVLDKVLRHGGPILEYATHIRKNWELNHSFPSKSAKDSESEIRVSDDPMGDFIRAYRGLYKRLREREINSSELYRQSPRALCFANASVHRYTSRLRYESLGIAAGSQWRPGEIVMIKSYCASATPKPIPSATDAIVIGSEIVNVKRSFALEWTTEKRGLERKTELVYESQAQVLSLHLIRPDGSVNEHETYKVGTPLIGDEESRDLYKSIKAKLVNCKLGSGHGAWKWLKEIKDQFRNQITSAFVMTVHKSQGSTFQDVYVCADVLKAPSDRNPLLYVSTTRASRSITFARQ